MKYRVTAGEHEYSVEIQAGTKPRSFVAIVDGRRHDVNVEQLPNGWLLSLLIDRRSYEIGIADGEIQVDGRSRAVQVERDFGSKRSSALASAGPARLRAPIPGLIVRVGVELGEQVQEGQALITLEAMKMQMELKSLRSGRVVELRAESGQEVSQGQTLVVIGD